jgi:hypothetical protein
MAGDWIKMRVDLQSHPKVVRILSATRTDKFRVIGGLHAVWAIFDTHSEDGELKGYTPELLDHIIGWDGFSRAMESVGWLVYDGLETLAMPEFGSHNGKSGKRRAEDQKRKQEVRESVRKLSANFPIEMRTREEKRREDQKQGGKPPLSTTDVDDAEAGESDSGYAIPQCPHGEILKLFADKLPELPQPRRSLWAESKNAEALRSRWRWVMTSKHEGGPRKGQPLAVSPEDGVAWFGRYFEYVRTCPLLMGEKGDWHADLGWLVNKANFAKVIQGNYEAEAA